MGPRQLVIIGAACLIAGAIGGGGWWTLGPAPLPEVVDQDAPMPVPPAPPRIAEGSDYDHCLSMLANDPEGANSFAETWDAAGGGAGATHCHALAQIALGNAETGAGLLETVAGDSRDDNAARAALFDQAEQAWTIAGNNAKAYDDASQALKLDPDDPDLLVDHAIAAATQERYDTAVADLDRALAIEPRRGDAMVYRAAAERHLGKLNLAEADVAQALSLDPGDADALLERGIIRQRLGDRAGAQEDWQRAMALAPNSSTSDLAEQDLALLEAGPEQR